MVGHVFAPAHHARGDVLVPPAERGYDEIVESAHDTCQQQWLGLVAALGARDEHLRRSRGFREGVLAVHLAHEVLAERNEEQDADDAAQERRDEDFHERSTHLRILCLQDVDGRQREDGASHHSTRAGTYRLDDDVLAQGLRALGGCRHAHSDDGDGDGSLKHLAHLQSEIGGCGREEHGHHHAPRHRPSIHLGIITIGRHQRFVLFTLLQLSECIFRQSCCQSVFFFHIVGFY